MNTLCRSLALLSALATPWALIAEDAPPGKDSKAETLAETRALSLAAIIDIAVTRHLPLQAERLRSEAAYKEAKAITDALRPSLSAQAGYVHQDLTSSGFPLADDEYTARLRATSPLFGIDLRGSAHRLADASRANADARLDGQERDVHLRTALLVEALLLDQALFKLSESRLEQRQQEWDDAKALLEAGKVSRLDERQARIAWHNQKQETQLRETALTNAHRDLALHLDLAPDSFTVSDRLERRTDSEAVLTTVSDELDTGIDLRIVDAGIAFNRAQADNLTATIRPIVSAGAFYQWQGEETDDLDEGWQVGISVDWKIFTGGAERDRIAAAKRRAAALHTDRSYTLQARHTAYAQLREQLITIEAQLELQRETVSLANQNYDDTRSQYQVGRLTITRLGEASLAVNEAETALLRLISQQRELLHRLESLAR